MPQWFRSTPRRKTQSRVLPTRRQVDIPASKARIGMHVVGLDRPWEDVPVLYQSFVIEQPEQVEALRTHCLWITVERTAYTEQIAEAARAQCIPGFSLAEHIRQQSATGDALATTGQAPH